MAVWGASHIRLYHFYNPLHLYFRVFLLQNEPTPGLSPDNTLFRIHVKHICETISKGLNTFVYWRIDIIEIWFIRHFE